MILLEPIQEYRQQIFKLNSMEAILVDKEVIINEYSRGTHISIAEAGVSVLTYIMDVSIKSISY